MIHEANLAVGLFKMASKLGKFERTFVFCEFVVITTNFWQKLVVNRTTAANFFPPNFVALLCHVTGMCTKVQMVDFVLVVVVVVGCEDRCYYLILVFHFARSIPELSIITNHVSEVIFNPNVSFVIFIEQFSNDCRKTKTKAITPTNHNRSRRRDEPITILSNYL